ncbi:MULTISPECIES: histidine phosphatase family protein [Oleiagrimonas]|uniref:Histidine phosphatase family protein n=1 Tax=Oleiagrimonas citrea TaxID=1665687 RepID=A0A846ZPE1_9GAMM|nr:MULTISPECIES: histidine phosphatase family protein [Oleiagrimonas]NKZ40145.1 histidine phosphatase family protein [Oleiagrimonas citrea]RAP57066.1 phosphoglycerate mutase [Oleiagrimonas sp. MCCC 1A03011]
MHDIILLRHAAAMSSAPDGTDGARPLSTLGENEARAAGRWLREHNVQPARVLCSPAQRALMTARNVLDVLGSDTSPTLEPAIYDAVPGTLINLIEQHATSGILVLVGHNPALEQLVGLLCEGRSSEVRGMPPAGLAWLRADLPLDPGGAQLHAFWSP